MLKNGRNVKYTPVTNNKKTYSRSLLTSRRVIFYNISLNPRLDQVASSLAQSARSATLLVSDEEKL